MLLRAGRSRGAQCARTSRKEQNRLSTTKSHRQLSPVASHDSLHEFFDTTGKRLNVKSLGDWYLVAQKEILGSSGSIVLKNYRNVVEALKACYSTHLWEEWRFKRAPKGFWSQKENRRKFLDSVGASAGISTLDMWYSQSVDLLEQNGGRSLVQLFHSSLIDILRDAYTEHEWLDWKFSHVPRGFWEDKENHKKYLLELATRLKIEHPYGWYAVKFTDIDAKGRKALEQVYGSTIASIIIGVFSDIKFDVNAFKSRSGRRTSQSEAKPKPEAALQLAWHRAGFDWKKRANQQSYLSWLTKELDIECRNDWYNVSTTAVLKLDGGKQFLAQFGGALHIALSDLIPGPEFFAWMFPKVSSEFWNDEKSQRKFMDWVSESMRLSTLAAWYEVPPQTIKDLGGSALLAKHNNSMIQLLRSVYPAHDWQEWMFNSSPRAIWDRAENHRRYLDWLSAKLRLPGFEGWYNVTLGQVRESGGAGLIEYCGSLASAVTSAYPEHPWDIRKFHQAASTSDIRNKLQIIGRDLGVEVLADWYKVVGDRRVAELAQYFGSPLALLQTTYPEHYWLPWLFPRVPSGFWKPQSNQRKYMDWLFGRLGLSRLDNWYDVKRSQLDKVGANSMLDVLYQGSLTKALTTLYPEHEWLEWMFDDFRCQWKDPQLLAKYFKWLSGQLKISVLSDWYSVPVAKIKALPGGIPMLKHFNGSLSTSLTTAYPNHQWEEWKFKKMRREYWEADRPSSHK